MKQKSGTQIHCNNIIMLYSFLSKCFWLGTKSLVEKVLVNKKADSVFQFESLYQHCSDRPSRQSFHLSWRRCLAMSQPKWSQRQLDKIIFWTKWYSHMYTDSHLSQSAKRIGFCPISALWLKHCYRHQHLWADEESFFYHLQANWISISPTWRHSVKNVRDQLNKVGAHLVLVLETSTEQQDIGTGSLSRYPCWVLHQLTKFLSEWQSSKGKTVSAWGVDCHTNPCGIFCTLIHKQSHCSGHFFFSCLFQSWLCWQITFLWHSFIKKRWLLS